MWKKILASVAQNHYTPVVLAIIVALLYLRYAPQRQPVYQPTPGPVVVAPEPKVVTKTVTRRVVVPGPERIVYLDRPEAAVALEMPELNTGADNIIAIATVPPHSGPTTAIARLSPSGEGSILLRQEPQKFLQLKREWGARAGMGTGGLVLGELYLRPLRVGPMEVELRGFGQRSNVAGADFGVAVLLDMKF